MGSRVLVLEDIIFFELQEDSFCEVESLALPYHACVLVFIIFEYIIKRFNKAWILPYWSVHDFCTTCYFV
jgi:hypothetical protein